MQRQNTHTKEFFFTKKKINPEYVYVANNNKRDERKRISNERMIFNPSQCVWQVIVCSLLNFRAYEENGQNDLNCLYKFFILLYFFYIKKNKNVPVMAIKISQRLKNATYFTENQMSLETKPYFYALLQTSYQLGGSKSLYSVNGLTCILSSAIQPK